MSFAFDYSYITDYFGSDENENERVHARSFIRIAGEFHIDIYNILTTYINRLVNT